MDFQSAGIGTIYKANKDQPGRVGTVLCPRGNSIDGGHSVPTLRFRGFVFLFSSPERRLDRARTSGAVGRALFEHVAA